MVAVASALVLFARGGSGGVVVRVGGGVSGAPTHSVGNADVNEVVPCRCVANDIHNGLSGLSLVDVVEFWYVLFSVAVAPHVTEPSVKDVASVVVFGYGVAAYSAGEGVVAVWVEWV